MRSNQAIGALAIALLVAAIAAVPAARIADAAESLSGTFYTNDQEGFKFRTFQGWTAFPPQPDDKVTIVHFRTSKADRGGYDGECYIARLTNDKCPSVEKYLSEEIRFRGVAVGAKNWGPAKQLPEGAVQYEFTLTAGSISATGIAMEIQREKDKIAIMYMCDRLQQKKYWSSFILSMASFKFIDSKVDDGGSLDASDDSTALEKRYKAEKAKCPPGWDIVKTKYYIIYFNCSPQDLNEVVTKLTLIRPEYLRYIPPLEKEFVDAAAPIVRVCKDQRDFASYSGMNNPGILGYWSPGVEELVVFKKSEYFGTMKKLFFDVLQHEGFHQYIHYACGRVDPCITFNEGPAEFFASFQQAGNKMVPTMENQTRKGSITEAVNSSTHVPIPTLLRYSQGQYYSNAGVCYAQGWALTTFLMLGDKVMGPQFKKEWSTIIPNYFKVLQAEVKKAYDAQGGDQGKVEQDSDRELFGLLGSAVKRDKITKLAMDEAIKDMDLTELENLWKTFVLKKL